MKLRLLAGLVAPLLVLGVACETRQTREGELPEVEIEGGQLPEYEVIPLEVETGRDTQEVVVPDIEVRRGEQDTIRRDTARDTLLMLRP